MTAHEYVDGTGRRMLADGCEVHHDVVGPFQVLVGRRKDFLPQALSRLHLVTVAAAVPHVGAAEVTGFARDVSVYAKQRTGALRGMQSGIGAFSVLVSHEVSPDAVAVANRKAALEFAVRVQPVVVDLGRGVLHTFTGTQLVGIVLNGHLRRKRELYLPPPGRG